MTRNFNDVIAALPEDEQIAIQQQADQLLESITLSDLRSDLGLSQQDVAEILHVNQAAVSKMERRADIHISKLYEIVQALGGELEITVRIPGKKRVRLHQFTKSSNR